MFILITATSKFGNTVIVTDTAGRDGGKFFHPRVLRVSVLRGKTSYRSSNASNICRTRKIGEYNAYSTRGPRSEFSRLLKEAESVAMQFAEKC